MTARGANRLEVLCVLFLTPLPSSLASRVQVVLAAAVVTKSGKRTWRGGGAPRDPSALPFLTALAGQACTWKEAP